MDLKRLNDENATAIRESISAQEQAMAEEQQLHQIDHDPSTRPQTANGPHV